MAYHNIKITDQTRWDAFVEAHPDGHVLQLADWGHLKTVFGWSAEQVAVGDASGKIVAGAQVLYRPLPFRLGQMAYIPAGPLFCEDEAANAQLWEAVNGAARKRRAVFLKVEPCNWYRPRPDLPGRLERAGLRLSPQTVQPPRTILLDIRPDEETILKRMNQSTRYKARLGPKKEVSVREGSSADVASFNRLMAATGERDVFGVHAPAYYQMVFDRFAPGGHCALLLASYAGQDLAGMMVLRCGPSAYYFYGASSNLERNRMPTYIVQWEGIRWARQQGALNYDLWGIPDADEATLDAEFEARQDGAGLWGVYGFKRGFGGQVVRSVGAWDKPYNALVYAAYRWYLRRRESR
jgi:lipid II:glycine glycyltransferase (peptidoglycan interpeptide bridge formation enzyme)